MSEVWLIGDPVGHSQSPAMHNAAFAALDLPHRYEAREVKAADLGTAIDRLRRGDVLGANVTIPHKESVVRLIDELADDARQVGAVNTLVRRGGRITGHNTDGFGFRRALDETGIAPRRVIVLGAGGAARACVVELLRAGADVRVANRTSDRAERLARSIKVEGRRAQAIRWPSQDDLDSVDTVVNATPLGLQNEDPLRGRRLPPMIVDLVPAPEETKLVMRAKETPGVRAIDGLVMLLHQAARSFELWTGLDAPVEVMRAALPVRPAPAAS